MRSSEKLNFVTLTGFLMLFCTFTQAQEKKLKYGFNGGITYTTFLATPINIADAADHSGPYRFRNNFWAEGTVDIRLKPSTSLSMGLKLIGKGAAYEKDFYGGDRPDVKLLMLQVPVNFTKNIKAGKQTLSLGGGPYLGYVVGGMKKMLSISYDDVYPYDNVPEYNVYTRWDVGAGLKAGYLLFEHMNVVAGYEISMLNIIKASSNSTVRNSAFTFGLGYSF